MEKHGYVVITCPSCGTQNVHHVATIGNEVFVCCRGCFETRRGLDSELPFDFLPGFRYQPPERKGPD